VTAASELATELEGFLETPDRWTQQAPLAEYLRKRGPELLSSLRRVEKLEGALETIAEEHDAGRHDGLPEPCPAHDADTMFAVARQALTGEA